MRTLFPAAGGVRAWHKRFLGAAPFRPDAGAASAAFFGPARALCRRPVPAEKLLPSSLPRAAREKLALALRLWQASQEITLAWARRGALRPGMDLPQTLNFAMALGNYSRFFLFSAGALPVPAELRLHAAFAAEMTAMPAAFSLRRLPDAYKPAASAARLAAAAAGAFGRGE